MITAIRIFRLLRLVLYPLHNILLCVPSSVCFSRCAACAAVDCDSAHSFKKKKELFYSLSLLSFFISNMELTWSIASTFPSIFFWQYGRRIRFDFSLSPFPPHTLDSSVQREKKKRVDNHPKWVNKIWQYNAILYKTDGWIGRTVVAVGCITRARWVVVRTRLGFGCEAQKTREQSLYM